MAYTTSFLKKSVFGDMRVNFIKVTSDSAEQTVFTGLNNILGISYCPQSATTGTKIFINVGSTGTALAGWVGLSSVTSGDVFFLTVFGD